MTRYLCAAVVIVSVLFGAAADAADEQLGRTHYLRYCSACHGPEGRGDGPVAPTLTPRPADLTRLAADNGGHFPFARVRDTIDGRKEIVAHGRPAMPVWGTVFDQEIASTMAAPAHTRAKVQSIASYLASIQAQ